MESFPVFLEVFTSMEGPGPFHRWHRLSKQAAPCRLGCSMSFKPGRTCLWSWAHRMAGRQKEEGCGVLMDLLVSPQLLPCRQTTHRAGQTGSTGAFCLIQCINNTGSFDCGASWYSCVGSRHFWLRMFSMLQTLALTANPRFWVG